MQGLRQVLDALVEEQSMCVTEEEVTCILTPLKHADPRVRSLSLAMMPQLVQEGDARALTPALRLLSDDGSYLVRAAAADAIGCMCPYDHLLAGQAVSKLIQVTSLTDTGNPSRLTQATSPTHTGNLSN